MTDSNPITITNQATTADAARVAVTSDMVHLELARSKADGGHVATMVVTLPVAVAAEISALLALAVHQVSEINRRNEALEKEE